MPFKFAPLEHADSIRLLVLQPAATLDAALNAALTHVRLEANPTFDAISYAWGDLVFSQQLHLPDGTLQITENLSNALRRFRLTDSPRAVWADQICINQEDKKEKGHQVGIMSKIYRGAGKVLIWLGEETPNTKRAVDFIAEAAESYGYEVLNNDINQQWWRGPPILKKKFDDAPEILAKAKESHIEDIYSRDWFSRLWVVQEVALARRASLYCGAIEVKWGTFGSAMTCLQAALNNFQTKLACTDAFESARNMIDIRQHYGDINEIRPSLNANKYQHFGIYMHMLRKQKCSDDRDRVYALYGLKPFYYDLIAQNDPEENSFTLEIDYNKPAFLIYREWALDLMSTGDINFMLDAGIWQRNVYLWYDDMEFFNGAGSWEKGLWIKSQDEDAPGNSDANSAVTLCRATLGKAYSANDKISAARASIEPSIQELPSWVPDLSNLGKKSYSLPWTQVHGMDGFQARSKPGLGGQQDIRWESAQGDIPRRIWAQAVILGEISSRLAIHEWDESQNCSRVNYMREITEVIEVLLKSFVSGEGRPWPIEEDLESALARTIFADGSGTVCQAFLRANQKERSSSPDGSKLVANPKELLTMWKAYNFSWGKLSQAKGGVSIDELSEDMQKMWESMVSIHLCLSEALEGHNFFLTDKRFIGLAPLVAKEGDLIALIDSVRTPVVLRSVKAGTEKGCIVVGPCYVHGVMYGETLPKSGSPLAQEGKYIPLI